METDNLFKLPFQFSFAASLLHFGAALPLLLIANAINASFCWYNYISIHFD